MNLQSQLTALKDRTQGLTMAARAKLCCEFAKQLEKVGDYEAACEALNEFWPEHRGLPNVEGLDEATTAKVLLRVGALAGWQGSAQQTEGSQEIAKNLITRSIEIFEAVGQSEESAEAHTDLAICYWREGSFDEARINLKRALRQLKDGDSDLRAVVLIWSGLVEGDAGRLNEALHVYNEVAPLIEQIQDHAIKGTFHSQFGLVFRRLATPENREHYLDRALIEYAAASFHFEQAGNERYLARVENNLGFLFFTIRRYPDAHQHLDRARRLFLELKDVGTVAQVDETRARTLLAEGRIAEAERVIRSAVKVLERGGQQALLAESLTTYGTVMARLGNYARSRAMLEEAIGVAEMAGDLEGAGRAKLSVIEELSEQTPAPELAAIYQTAADLLQRSQDPSAGKRLIACAAKVIEALGGAAQLEDSANNDRSWEGFSFKRAVLKSEKALIARALRDAGGSVTRAARLLGFRHHQSLISLINSRHQDLLNTRSAVRKRRSHIFSMPRKIKKKVIKQSPQRASSQISVLHIEDNEQIAKFVRGMFAPGDWHVELCADGYGALEKLTGNTQYDVLVVDNDLPGLSGLEVVQRARKITHRRRTPTVLLAGSDCEAAAWGAGVDAFLRKPEQLGKLPATINRLLKAELRKAML
jgi:CheY-like chemotaxis protein/tetratricopeptide (TPR) repeat protein